MGQRQRCHASTNRSQTNRGVGGGRGGQVMDEQAKHQRQTLAPELGKMVHMVLTCVHMEKELLKVAAGILTVEAACKENKEHILVLYLHNVLYGHWAAWYSTWLLIEVNAKSCSLFFSFFLSGQMTHESQGWARLRSPGALFCNAFSTSPACPLAVRLHDTWLTSPSSVPHITKHLTRREQGITGITLHAFAYVSVNTCIVNNRAIELQGNLLCCCLADSTCAY